MIIPCMSKNSLAAGKHPGAGIGIGRTVNFVVSAILIRSGEDRSPDRIPGLAHVCDQRLVAEDRGDILVGMAGIQTVGRSPAVGKVPLNLLFLGGIELPGKDE